MQSILYKKRSHIPLLYLLILLLCWSCGGSQQEPQEIVFAFGPDDEAQGVQQLIDDFNKEYEGQIKVSWKEGSRFSDAFYHELKAEFESGNPQFDVIGADVIWTPAFASNGWVEDITQQFFAAHNPTDYLEIAMESVSYQFKIWGIPWYTDAGMLYYRKDLLERLDIADPPATWEELIVMAKTIQKEVNIPFGYVFQGANYEGGVTNACEFIWNAEGDILIGDLSSAASFDTEVPNTDLIVVNSDASRRGLEDLVKIKESGILPPNIHELREKEAAEYFRNGQTIFMRSWASSFGSLAAKESKLKPDQIGLTPLPTSDRTMVPYSCLGGWNLMVSSFSSPEKKEAAWKFMQYASSKEAQRTRVLKVGSLPTLRSLYEDETLLKQAPVANLARQVIPVCKVRPRSPFYMQMSPKISGVFADLLQGKMSPDEAVKALDSDLSQVLAEYH